MSNAIQALGRRYVRYFNFLHERCGTLWQGRFHSSVVDTDRYFLICQRYIELNPVRAGLCGHPVEFPWSSHRHYARGTPDDLVTPHSIHTTFDAVRYHRLFEEFPLNEDVHAVRDALNNNLPLGDETFRERMGALTGRRTERSRKGRRSAAQTKQIQLI